MLVSDAKITANENAGFANPNIGLRLLKWMIYKQELGHTVATGPRCVVLLLLSPVLGCAARGVGEGYAFSLLSSVPFYSNDGRTSSKSNEVIFIKLTAGRQCSGSASLSSGHFPVNQSPPDSSASGGCGESRLQRGNETISPDTISFRTPLQVKLIAPRPGRPPASEMAKYLYVKELMVTSLVMVMVMVIDHWHRMVTLH